MSPQLIGQTATWLSIVNQLFETRMSQLLAPHDLTNGQFGILHHIMRDPEKSYRISDIARAVEVGQPAVTKAIAKFEVRGMVTLKSDPKDRRVTTVHPTALAGQVLMETRQAIWPKLSEVFDGFEPPELENLTGQLKRIAANLDETR